jgi:hypothetical protein
MLKISFIIGPKSVLNDDWNNEPRTIIPYPNMNEMKKKEKENNSWILFKLKFKYNKNFSQKSMPTILVIILSLM